MPGICAREGEHSGAAEDVPSAAGGGSAYGSSQRQVRLSVKGAGPHITAAAPSFSDLLLCAHSRGPGGRRQRFAAAADGAGARPQSPDRDRLSRELAASAGSNARNAPGPRRPLAGKAPAASTGPGCPVDSAPRALGAGGGPSSPPAGCGADPGSITGKRGGTGEPCWNRGRTR